MRYWTIHELAKREHRLAGKAFRGPWIPGFLEEFTLFPHDDQIDAVSLAVQMIASRRIGAYGF